MPFQRPFLSRPSVALQPSPPVGRGAPPSGVSGPWAWAVVGAAYGDEGKGLAVDALPRASLAEGAAPLVVRANGGAQAGHTVETPDGRRHVFHHLGSASFLGVPTHLSRFFVLHPTFLRHEMADLSRKLDAGMALRVSCDPDAPVTTPWDMLVNQVAETVRAGGRHGSCGLGFGETWEREEKGPRLHARDLPRAGLRATLRAIREEWVPRRLAALGIDAVPAPFDAVLADPRIEEAFLDDVAVFLSNVEQVEDRAALAGAGRVLFEGAQGLMLDQSYGAFPHVTRSHTGLHNPAILAREAGLGGLHAWYMTRAYGTRHGAGPFPGEVEALEGVRVVDATNVPNAWQGTLRVAPVDAGALRAAIAWDVGFARQAAPGLGVEARLGITHLDCIDDAAPLRDGEALVRPGKAGFAQALAGRVGIAPALWAHGPHRDAVTLSVPPSMPRSPAVSVFPACMGGRDRAMMGTA